jgi:hypothetical protein
MHAGVHAFAPEPSPANHVDFAGRLTSSRSRRFALVGKHSFNHLPNRLGEQWTGWRQRRAECKFYVPCSLDHNLQILRVVAGKMLVSASET